MLSLLISLTHITRITLIGNMKYLIKYWYMSDPRLFYNFTRIVSRRSIARPICRAFDQQLESRVEKYTGRLQVRCSYLLASTSLPFFLFLPSFYFSRSRSFLLSLSLARFSFAPSFPRRSALEFAKLTREIDHPAYLRQWKMH